ncbi:hypothetical protein M1N47_04575 [Dehalococcoidia bacterium]|nr:hypothetical protein [Dehalococcoidia bacterium]
MRRRCEVCGREIKPFAEFWLREPDQYDDKGAAIKQGRAMPFCSTGCIFGWSGKELRRQERERENVR